ncbi:FG-GAP-like repeat-containing protein [Ruegeria sp. 2205SS24-7]|uniref:FG-GAP-like repeat-containing protein n=1 Tax=Ruegeria discodermiae TaxID=3064389 RepID=UPI002741D1FE|nr:FG-GAP-like repeat-containing protein [Ruegeria sp. 2205SS24-7]MDP5217248.1 FG-GAP-like repeat-containing protein [Ruegeria sp. 2205SS24-7]
MDVPIAAGNLMGRKGLRIIWVVISLLAGLSPALAAPYPENPMVFELDIPLTSPKEGGLFAHDLTGDGNMDFLITAPGHIAAYSNKGAPLWHIRDNINLGKSAQGFSFPGTHGPGAIAGDMDGDGAEELAYLRPDGTLVIREGGTGQIKRSYDFPGAQGVAIADFRGTGDRDAVLQYSQNELRAISLETGETFWHVTDWQGVEHGIVRVLDLDGDGRDEVLGPILLDSAGQVLRSAAREGTKMNSFDSLAVGDILPAPGLEIALAEQHGNDETIVMGVTGPGWWRHHEPGGIWAIGECRRREDPDKLAVGEFDPDHPGEEVFARSSCGNHPWVMAGDGSVIASWSVSDTAPPGWCHVGDCRADPEANFLQRLNDRIKVDLRGGRSPRRGEYGIDLVRPVHWDGTGRQLLFVTERHIDGQIALVDALTGEFLRVWPTEAARTYAADVTGDAREELIVLEARPQGSTLKIFWNDEPAKAVTQDRLWQDRAYRRGRQNWNYYSP